MLRIHFNVGKGEGGGVRTIPAHHGLIRALDWMTPER